MNESNASKQWHSAFLWSLLFITLSGKLLLQKLMQLKSMDFMRIFKIIEFKISQWFDFTWLKIQDDNQSMKMGRFMKLKSALEMTKVKRKEIIYCRCGKMTGKVSIWQTGNELGRKKRYSIWYLHIAVKYVLRGFSLKSLCCFSQIFLVRYVAQKLIGKLGRPFRNVSRTQSNV